MKRLVPGILLLWILFCSCEQSYDIIPTQFENEGINFSAEIYKPVKEGKFPAVVMVHGSKNHTKDYYTEYSKYFAEKDIVTLHYDNRGHGESEGDLWTSDFMDLAGDVVAAVEFLQSQPFVDPENTGLWADSHGGWISLIADSLSSDIDFIINKSGPLVTPLQCVFHDVEHNYLIPQKVPAPIRAEILQLYPRIFKYTTRSRSDSLWQDIHEIISAFEATDYFKNSFDEYYLSILASPGEMPPISKLKIAPSGRNYDFDPLLLVRSMKARMLLIFGTGDALIPVQQCIQIAQQSDQPKIELLIYPGADHGIRIQDKPDWLFRAKFPEGYLSNLVDFIRK